MNIYCVYDTVALCSCSVFVAHNDDTAKRMFSQDLTNPRSILFPKSKDLVLKKLCSFDEHNLVITDVITVQIMTGLELPEKATYTLDEVLSVVNDVVKATQESNGEFVKLVSDELASFKEVIKNGQCDKKQVKKSFWSHS